MSASAASRESVDRVAFADAPIPDDVLFWMRMPAPGRDTATLGQLLGLGLLLQPSELLSRKLGPTLTGAIDWSKPLDVTLAGFNDAPGGSIVCGVKSVSEFAARISADFELAHLKAGRWNVKAKRSDQDPSPLCEVWQAPEPVGARLLCALDQQTIERQGPFLMSAARLAFDKSGLHAEMPSKSVVFALEKSAAEQVDSPLESDESPAQHHLGRDVSLAFARELSGLSLDVGVTPAAVLVAQEMRFSKAESLISLVLSGRVGAPQSVPDAFWQLPADSDLSLYSEGAEPELLRKMAATTIQRLLDGIAADSEYEEDPAERAEGEQVLRSCLLRGGAWQFSYGQDLEQASNVLAEAAKKARDNPRLGSSDPALKLAQAHLGGWALVGLEDDSQALLEAVRDGARLEKKPKRTRHKDQDTPRKAGSPSLEVFTLIPPNPSAGLPKDTLHVAVSSRPNPKYIASDAEPAPVPYTFHIFAVPDSKHHLWLGISRDELTATTRLRALLSPDATKTLGANEELRQLAKSPKSSLGYMSIAGITALGLSANSKSDVLRSKQHLSRIWALPKRGTTHTPFWVTRQTGAGTERRVTFQTRLPAEALADLLQIVIGAGLDLD